MKYEVSVFSKSLGDNIARTCPVYILVGPKMGYIFTQNRSPYARLYSKVWPMLSIFDSNKQKTPLEISLVFDRWGAVL
jgi:hypothetical protein